MLTQNRVPECIATERLQCYSLVVSAFHEFVLLGGKIAIKCSPIQLMHCVCVCVVLVVWWSEPIGGCKCML